MNLWSKQDFGCLNLFDVVQFVSPTYIISNLMFTIVKKKRDQDQMQHAACVRDVVANGTCNGNTQRGVYFSPCFSFSFSFFF